MAQIEQIQVNLYENNELVGPLTIQATSSVSWLWNNSVKLSWTRQGAQTFERITCSVSNLSIGQQLKDFFLAES